MEALKYYPFNKLSLPPDEEALWCAYNPTFHRTSDYGIAISTQALYLYSPFWLWFAKWRRYPLKDITGSSFHNSKFLPKFQFRIGSKTITFRTPYDTYKDEMDFDRKNLVQAVCFIEHRRVHT